ncbi:MAG: GDP-mannose 4,6-dehydratase [Elusimicrobia bacterium]|nr:GDP-mannose 4,6-dehydratase [Elusimicrobiota bacterium]
MRYLITGGAGFIGSHLAEALLDKGEEVAVIDDLSTGSMRNIEHLKARPGLRYVIDSIMNKPLLAELVDDSDCVVHLAAAVGVKLIVDSPVRTIVLNVEGTSHVLECATKKKKKVLLASTSEVYGKADKFPFKETSDLLIGPPSKGRWSYACSKALDEFLALAYHKEKGLPVVIVRLFNTVGPRQTGQYGMVVPNFVKQALLGQPITVYGTGRQSRCFVHVRDVVKALIALTREPKAVGQIFNLGSTEEVSILALAKLVKLASGSRSEIRRVPYDHAYEEGFEDMFRRVPDTTKARKLIGFKPSADLAGILADVIEYYRRGEGA